MLSALKKIKYGSDWPDCSAYWLSDKKGVVFYVRTH